MFESRLLGELERLDPRRPTVVEAESSKIGAIVLPPVLWSAMATAPRVEITAPAPVRARYLLAAYHDLAADPAALAAALRALPGRHGRARLAAWLAQAAAGDFAALAQDLVEVHYDPAYETSRRKDERPCLGVLAMTSLAPAGRQATARRIATLVGQIEPAS
jgi:tRNA 2-selenouridine synthase